jgi:hypothetical protein
VKAAGLPSGYGLRDLRHYLATVLIYGGANVKTVQLAMGHTTPTVTLNTYVGYWPDAIDQTGRCSTPRSVVPALHPQALREEFAQVSGSSRTAGRCRSRGP